jgi:hypothetical protein
VIKAKLILMRELTMKYRSVFFLKHLKVNGRDCRDLADALARLDPKSPDFDVEVDLAAAVLCQGKELRHFDDCSLMDARLLISGVIAAYASCPRDAPLSLTAVKDLIASAHLFAFCRASMTFGPYVRSRLCAHALPHSETNKALQAIKRTATAILDTHCRLPKRSAPI